MLMANGNIEQLYFAGEPPELVVPLQINGSYALAVVPGAALDLRLTLQPHQLSSVSTSQGWQVRFWQAVLPYFANARLAGTFRLSNVVCKFRRRANRNLDCCRIGRYYEPRIYRLRENSVAGKRHYSVTSPSPHSATLQCVRKVQTVRQKQKFIGIVAIWNGFEVLICARIESDHHIEPLASGFLDVESRHPTFDLRNSLFPRQCPMSSVRVIPANGMNTKCPGSVCRHDLAYAEISSHWFLTSMMMGTKGY
jgi:hypothetical protein